MGIGGVCVLVTLRIRSIVLNDSQHRVVYWTAQYLFQAIIRSGKQSMSWCKVDQAHVPVRDFCENESQTLHSR